MRVAALDLGSHMAIAMSGTTTIPPWGKVGHQEFKGPRAHRAGATFEWLEKVLGLASDYGIEAVVYETPFARGRDATRCLWGIAGLIEAVATKVGLPVVDIQPSAIKKWVTGSGKASKEDMIAGAKKLGWPECWGEPNEHQADAYCLMRYGEANIEEVK